MSKTPRTFISYSWSSPQHEDWVINLAERLVANGVDVTIDKWDLKEGHDKFEFMESMVKSTDIDRVLIVLDKKYAEKAEQKMGGVGTETQIISPNVYENVSQEKFVPIIAERDLQGNPYVPTYLKSRMYIDLSDNDHYEENYEKLLRNLYQRPAYSKPQLGTAPGYLFEETPMTHKTSIILRSFENNIAKNPHRINSTLRDFLAEFTTNLAGYALKLASKDQIGMGKEIYDNINLMTPLRNDFINFFEKITQPEYQFDIEIVLKFIEKLPLFKRPMDGRGSWSHNEFDNFRFIIHEIFLYLIAIGLKNENYKFLEEIFYSSYFFKDSYDYTGDPGKFTELYNYVESFDSYYNQTFSSNFISPMADFLIKRIPEGYTKNNIVEADLLCHHVASLNHYLRWFPLTYIYDTRGPFELFSRFVSTRHFEKAKVLFNVTTPEELKGKLKKLEEETTGSQQPGYSNSFDYIRPLYKMIKADTIAQTR